jgi:hypothetical protein
MVDHQASDLYVSDTDTWSASSLIQCSGKEPTVDSHSPSRSHTRKEPPKLCRESLAASFVMLCFMVVSV